MNAEQDIIKENINTYGGGKSFITMLFVMIVAALCWFTSIDEYAFKYLDSSLKGSLVVYGVSRSANALISVLQTASVPGLFTIGQALDPLNSLIERFSAIMELAIGSLVIQRVLVEVFSSFGFKMLVTITGFGLCLAIYLNKKFGIRLGVKIFATLVLLRFTLVAVVFMCAWIDHLYIDEKIKLNRQKVEWVSSEVAKSDGISGDATNQSGNVKGAVNVPSINEQAVDSAPNGEGKFQGFLGSVTNGVDKLKNMVSEAKNNIKSAVQKINPVELKKRMEDFVPNVLNLISYFILKTIILPLIFLYVCERIYLEVWSFDAAGLMRRSEYKKHGISAS